jgi:hypothetical protein
MAQRGRLRIQVAGIAQAPGPVTPCGSSPAPAQGFGLPREKKGFMGTIISKNIMRIILLFIAGVAFPISLSPPAKAEAVEEKPVIVHRHHPYHHYRHHHLRHIDRRDHHEE